LNPDLDTDTIRIQSFDDQKLKKKNTDLIMQKLQFTYVQATGKAFRPQKKNIQHFQKMKFINNFLCLWLIFSFWIRNRNPDPGTPLNPDPQQWLSMFHLAASTWCCS
jgi:hypothetical protein